MSKCHSQSGFAFQLMSLEFRFRDWLRSPPMILRAAGVLPGMTVLDFGCGPGGFSLAAAQLVGTHGRVYALDIHPLALKEVYRAAAKKGLRNIHPIHGANANDLTNESIDFVLVYDVLHDISEPVTVLKEIHRVLKTNGVLSVGDHHLKEASLMNLVAGGGLFRHAQGNRWTYQFERTVTTEEAR